mmetsp:Transcript_140535/g.356707  ORF Transcript_140535/g.356707 Transcript_140535/m.356707 type:complete len:172 (+) Transcript_140535:106-621(+)
MKSGDDLDNVTKQRDSCLLIAGACSVGIGLIYALIPIFNATSDDPEREGAWLDKAIVCLIDVAVTSILLCCICCAIWRRDREMLKPVIYGNGVCTCLCVAWVGIMGQGLGAHSENDEGVIRNYIIQIVQGILHVICSGLTVVLAHRFSRDLPPVAVEVTSPPPGIVGVREA